MILHGTYQPGALIFPGSFNPMHRGHVAMARIASARYSATVQPEISVVNVDKPTVEEPEWRRRLTPVQELGPPLVTRAALFAYKAECFPGCRFVIGADTAIRLADIRYYGDAEAGPAATFDRIERCRCRFVVFGRLVAGRFLDAASLELPASLKRLCDFVSETDFRIDVSSTQLRRGVARPNEGGV